MFICVSIYIYIYTIVCVDIKRGGSKEGVCLGYRSVQVSEARSPRTTHSLQAVHQGMYEVLV
jgi:hypothetical protein